MDKFLWGIMGIITLMLSSLIMLWRKVENKVNYKSCNDKHDHQTKLNIEVIERLATVETKIEMGFKNISDKIDKNGKGR